MVVPDEVTREFDRFEVAVVHFTDDAWIPVVGERTEFVLEINDIHDLTPRSALTG